MVKITVERICKKGVDLTHQKARKVLRQLKTNPEVCEDCEIKPCVFAEYVYGKNLS